MFNISKERAVPIVMLTSGGYQDTNAQIIGDSIINLFNENTINVIEVSANIQGTVIEHNDNTQDNLNNKL